AGFVAPCYESRPLGGVCGVCGERYGPGYGDRVTEDLDSAGRPEQPSGGVVDLLGVLAYGELSAFERLAEDARGAPTLSGRAALARMAAAEIGHYGLLEQHLAERGVDVEDAMTPFVRHFDEWHASTAPTSWLESLVKACVGDGLASGPDRGSASGGDGPSGEVGRSVRSDGWFSEFAERAVRAGSDADPSVRGRLALWGRRLGGYELTHA